MTMIAHQKMHYAQINATLIEMSSAIHDKRITYSRVWIGMSLEVICHKTFWSQHLLTYTCWTQTMLIPSDKPHSNSIFQWRMVYVTQDPFGLLLHFPAAKWSHLYFSGSCIFSLPWTIFLTPYIRRFQTAWWSIFVWSWPTAIECCLQCSCAAAPVAMIHSGSTNRPELNTSWPPCFIRREVDACRFVCPISTFVSPVMESIDDPIDFRLLFRSWGRRSSRGCNVLGSLIMSWSWSLERRSILMLHCCPFERRSSLTTFAPLLFTSKWKQPNYLDLESCWCWIKPMVSREFIDVNQEVLQLPWVAVYGLHSPLPLCNSMSVVSTLPRGFGKCCASMMFFTMCDSRIRRPKGLEACECKLKLG